MMRAFNISLLTELAAGERFNHTHNMYTYTSYNMTFVYALCFVSCSQKDVYLRGDPKSEARVRRINIDIEHLDLGNFVYL